jgi:hypothetical protein
MEQGFSSAAGGAGKAAHARFIMTFAGTDGRNKLVSEGKGAGV